MTAAASPFPFARALNGFLVAADPTVAELFRSLWPDDQANWTVFERAAAAVEQIFTSPPDILVADSDLPDMTGADLVSLVKSENVYRQLPAVLIVGKEHLDADTAMPNAVMPNAIMPNAIMTDADDFLTKPLDPAEVRARCALTLDRAARNLDANPLTRLPGNTSIIQRIQQLIDAGEEFALAYIDLDNFKSFNDKYGFSRGDEVLLMCARVIVNTIRGMHGEMQGRSFVGHVGGDDYVFIVPATEAETACSRVIENFDAIVPNFYDREDRDHHGIQSTDRQGNPMFFPLMSLSIAVVCNWGQKLKHFGEASQIAGGLKKAAKAKQGSAYVLDQRRQ